MCKKNVACHEQADFHPVQFDRSTFLVLLLLGNYHDSRGGGGRGGGGCQVQGLISMPTGFPCPTPLPCPPLQGIEKHGKAACLLRSIRSSPISSFRLCIFPRQDCTFIMRSTDQRGLNTKRPIRSSSFWVSRNLSNHMDRQACTGAIQCKLRVER